VTDIGEPGLVPYQVPDRCERLAQIQSGVISRQQALACLMEPYQINGQLKAGRWQTLRRGVYSVFNGPPIRPAILWAAVLSLGPGAALSHDTAAELFKITDWSSPLIHVTIPWQRRIDCPPDMVLYRSTRLADAVHPTLLPPRTRVEETVLDLVASATDFEAAFGVASAACQRKLTTTARLTIAMASRARLRWRAELAEALRDVADGVHSLLECRYVRRVERPHGLPAASRQARVTAGQRTRYLDNLYDGYGLCVELDGQQAHPDHQRWDDQRRTNAITAQGVTTLRYGWIDVDRRPCQTAAQIGAALRARGWPGRLRPCAPNCPVQG
jgi:very-short-patch-repair endonuclease